MQSRLKKIMLAAVAAISTVAAVAAPAQALNEAGGDLFSILPPGEYGGLPPTHRNSTDQMKMYDGLTPLFDNVTASDIPKYFKPFNLGLPANEATPARTERPRKGVEIKRDSYNVPHVYGKTRADTMFGAGWVMSEDRALIADLFRSVAPIAAIDAPGYSAFDLASDGASFEASQQTKDFLAKQLDLLRAQGKDGQQVIVDVNNYVKGINAQRASIGNEGKPWTSLDVISSAAIVGAVFGHGGGAEVASAGFRSMLQAKLGQDKGTKAWKDFRSQEDPEAPVTVSTNKRFDYGLQPSGPTPGSVVPDYNSISSKAVHAESVADTGQRSMSNAVVVGGSRSASGRPIAVFGPQTGYFYPEILLESDLHGPGISARGASFPGISMYVQLGRGSDYSWSATSAGNDIVDQFLVPLCNPGGGKASRSSSYYKFNSRCIKMKQFNAGTLTANNKITKVKFKETVQGPVAGTVLVGGKPYAIASRRSTRGREVLSGIAFKKLTESKPRNVQQFMKIAGEIEFTFNWFYADNKDIGYFSSGRMPVRAPGTDPSLPTLGNGKYEWRGYLPAAQHPQEINPADGIFDNWNNKPARGWAAADNNYGYSSVYRVDMFRDYKQKSEVHDVVAVMNRAATTDLRTYKIWPYVKRILATGPAPDAQTQAAADQISTWAEEGSSRLDRDLDGKIDAPGAAVMDKLWDPITTGVFGPVIGADGLRGLEGREGRDDKPGSRGSAYQGGWYGFLDKDLRTALGDPVTGQYNLRYCGEGDFDRCREVLWTAVKVASDKLASEQGPDPAQWHSDATKERIKFAPNLLRETMRWTNRPTFQQVVSYKTHN